MSDLSETAMLDPLVREGLDWIVRLTSGAATEADARAFQRWRASSPAHERACREVAALRRTVLFAAQDLVLEGPAQAGTGKPALLGRRAFLGGAIAATAACAVLSGPELGLWPTFSELSADYRTGTGERRKIALAKGLWAELNTKTSLSLRASGAEVALVQGEAFFAIDEASPHPVSVAALDGIAQAANARFDVRHTDEDVCVTCVSGLVKVTHNGRAVSLEPGQQVSYSSGWNGPVERADTSATLAWQEGRLIFRDQPLRKVLADINRYRPGRIILLDGQWGNKTFNGVIQLDHLDGVINVLQQIGATVVQLPGGLVVVS